MEINKSIFKSYDIRGIYPKELNEEAAFNIGRSFVSFCSAKKVAVGQDARISSPALFKALASGIKAGGAEVHDIGQAPTECLYFAVGAYDFDVGVMITASHNPKEYNGLKMVKKGAIAISGDSGIYAIRDLALSQKKIEFSGKSKGKLSKRNIMDGWIKHLMSFIDMDKMKPFKVVSDTGNGMAGYFMPHLEKKLPWDVTRLFYDLDGRFPNHVPSPIEEKNRMDCISKVKEEKADFGLVFDGDGDRVFMIDEKGRTLSGTIMTAAIAENILQKNPGSTILYNAIVGRVVPEIIANYNGKPERVRVGHTLIKEAMRKFDGIFCGEHSGHYYFKQNFYADSAIIAALLVAELMSVKNKKLSDIYDEYDKYPASGEINFEVQDKEGVMKKIEQQFKSQAQKTDWLDGISIWFADYWFNVRPSNTEPLLRLNVEADNSLLLEEKVKELVVKIESLGAKEKI